jgi:polysaccharide biosynthesis transport protein
MRNKSKPSDKYSKRQQKRNQPPKVAERAGACTLNQQKAASGTLDSIRQHMDQTNSSPPVSPETQLMVHPMASFAGRRTPYPSQYPNSYAGSQDLEGNGRLLRIWQTLARRSKTLLFSSAGGLILGYLITLMLQPVYRTQTSLEVVALNQDFLNMKQASPTSQTDNSYDTSEEATEAKLLLGANLADRVIGKLAPDSGKTAQPIWPIWLRRPGGAQSWPRKLLLKEAASSLKVRATPHTRVLEITVDSVDAQLARDFANTLTQEFIARKGEEHWATAQSTHEWLRRELDDAKSDLRRSEDELQRYARTSGIVLTDETTNVATEKLQQLQKELSAASADRIAKQSRFELAQNSPADSLADVLNDDGRREEQSKINDLSRQLANLSTIYGANYSTMRRTQAELAALQLAMSKQRDEILARIRTDYADARRREDLLANAYDGQTHEVTDQGEKTVQYKILKREVESNRQLYDTMLQQMKQSSIASALRANTVRVVDQAKIPELPVFPDFKIDSAAGMVLGFFASVIVILMRDEMDRTLQQPGDVKQWVDLPELGAIPNARVQARSGPDWRRASVLGGLRTRYSTSGALIPLQEEPSLVAEAFRSALTSILYTSESGKRPQVLVFTSANPADGKTTVVSNLAIASAEIRLRVLVIDADLRRPRMHKLFDLSNDQGLSDFLREEFREGGLSLLVQETKVNNLHILTSGAGTQNAANLLHSPNLPKLVKSLRKQYDMILIDTPPMMQMTDARIVSREADAVVLVARSGRTSRDSLAAAKGRFDEDHTQILGTMLTDWDPRRSKQTYSYGGYAKQSLSYRPDRDAW